MRSAFCTRKCDGSARSSCALPTPIRCRPAARSRSIAMNSPPPSPLALDQHPLIAIERAEIAGLPPADWDSVIVATGPLTSPALADAIRDLSGDRRRWRFSTPSRRSCIATRIDMDVGLVPVALRQGRARRLGRRLHQLPARPRAIRGLRRCPDRRPRRSRSTNGRRRPPISTAACRSRSWRSAGARRCATARSSRSGSPIAHNPTEKAYAVVQLRQDNRLGTLFNMVGFQTKLKHGEQMRIFRTIPGLEQRRIRPSRRAAPQHLSQFAEACSIATLAPYRDAAAALCRPDHRLRRLCGIRRDRPAGGPLRRRRAAGRAVDLRRLQPRRMAPCWTTSPAAISRPSMPARARSSR